MSLAIGEVLRHIGPSSWHDRNIPPVQAQIDTSKQLQLPDATGETADINTEPELGYLPWGAAANSPYETTRKIVIDILGIPYDRSPSREALLSQIIRYLSAFSGDKAYTPDKLAQIAQTYIKLRQSAKTASEFDKAVAHQAISKVFETRNNKQPIPDALPAQADIFVRTSLI